MSHLSPGQLSNFSEVQRVLKSYPNNKASFCIYVLPYQNTLAFLLIRILLTASFWSLPPHLLSHKFFSVFYTEARIKEIRLALRLNASNSWNNLLQLKFVTAKANQTGKQRHGGNCIFCSGQKLPHPSQGWWSRDVVCLQRPQDLLSAEGGCRDREGSWAHCRCSELWWGEDGERKVNIWWQ